MEENRALKGRCRKGKLLKQTHLLNNFYVDHGGSNYQNKTGIDVSVPSRALNKCKAGPPLN